MNPIVSTLIKGMLYLILKAKQGGKYLDRKKVVDRKTGKMRYKYKYKPMQQRAAHEVTRGKFEKVTKLSGDEHKNQIEHALQNGIHVSLHVLRDYPDLAVKYHQQARLAKADKIRAKVKASKEKLITQKPLIDEFNKFSKEYDLKQKEIRDKEEKLRGNIKPVLDLSKIKDALSVIMKVNEKLLAEKLSNKADSFFNEVRDIYKKNSHSPEDLKNVLKIASNYVTVSDNREVENNFDTINTKKERTLDNVIPDEVLESANFGNFDKDSSTITFTSLRKKVIGDNKKEYVLTPFLNRFGEVKIGVYIKRNKPDTKNYSNKFNQDYVMTNSISETPKNIEREKAKVLEEVMSTYKDQIDKLNNFDTMPESKPEPAKSPDLKANFESWKEERKTAAPAFKLEQEDITSKEKNTRFNDAQGGLFGKKPVTHESFAKKDFKPLLALEGNETITSLVTAVKSALMREGLDTKAREFVDKAFKEKDIDSLKKLASEYVDMKESSQVSSLKPENKGSEEKKMENSVNEAKKQELLEIGDLLVADNNSTTWNTFSNSEKARNKDLFTGRVNKFLPKIQTTVSTENVSPKQISYAEAAKYSNIDLVRTTFKNKLTSSKNKEEFTKVLDHMVKLDTLLNSKTDTLWWLKNKDMGYKSYQELQKMFPNTLK